MRITTLALVLSLIGTASACNQGELTRPRAEAVIGAHLEAVAPSTFGTGRAEIQVTEILAPTEYERMVRFLLVTRWDTPQGDERADTLRTAAYFTRSDAGWSFSSYDPGLAEEVANAVAEEQSQQYADLLDLLRGAFRLVQNWESRVSDQADAVGVETAEGRRLLLASFEGPSATEIERLLADSLDVPSSLEWGAEQVARLSPVIWVRRAADPEVMCAQRTQPTATSAEFWWLNSEYGHLPTCRGPDRMAHNEGAARDALLEEILKAGILRR
jgi:hypothetical protein